MPEVTEEPHFAYTSFRVKGKIFATAPPDGEHLHIFVAKPKCYSGGGNVADPATQYFLYTSKYDFAQTCNGIHSKAKLRIGVWSKCT